MGPSLPAPSQRAGSRASSKVEAAGPFAPGSLPSWRPAPPELYSFRAPLSPRPYQPAGPGGDRGKCPLRQQKQEARAAPCARTGSGGHSGTEAAHAQPERGGQSRCHPEGPCALAHAHVCPRACRVCVRAYLCTHAYGVPVCWSCPFTVRTCICTLHVFLLCVCTHVLAVRVCLHCARTRVLACVRAYTCAHVLTMCMCARVCFHYACVAACTCVCAFSVCSCMCGMQNTAELTSMEAIGHECQQEGTEASFCLTSGVP